MPAYERRYSGTRWSIIYGAYDGVEGFAVNELQAAVQRYLPYVVEVRSAPSGLPEAAGLPATGEHLMLVGTPADSPLIGELVRQGLIARPTREQGYTITCAASPYAEGARLVAIAGFDAPGVLYGVEDFCAHVLAAGISPDGPAHRREAFDRMPDCALAGSPAIAARGLWTWGYVIYDYRRFIDHMARLKLNRLTVWNDCPPLNCRAVIDYAHTRGVDVILGFHWGWGLSLDLANAADRETIRGEVLRTYRENYRGLGMDGIYFQTLTEHSHTEMGGRSVAALVCELVNEVAGALLALDPDLYIQFGLHATSIRDRWAELAALDPRVSIVWEDAGVIPYAYDPVTAGYSLAWDAVATPEGTIEYSRKLATLRPGCEFGMVPKGWICLRWAEEFEHHGPFILGERDPSFIRRRLADRQPRWDAVNALWLRNYRHAVRFYREMLDVASKMTVAGLVEDGMFEDAIQPSVALFAQTLWDPTRDEDEILQLSLSPYYRE